MKIQILRKDGSKGFKFLTGINRDIIPSQVTKLASSIECMGIIRPVVVADIDFLGEKGTYILDGQHLFYALMRLDQDIPYTKIQVKDKKDMIVKISLLNASSKSWMMLDYITAWSCISEDYKKLMYYYNMYDFEICLLGDILMGRSSCNLGGTCTMRVKKGEFKIVKEAEQVVILDRLTDMLKVAPRMDRVQNLYICREYVSFLKDAGKAYNHEKFISSLAKKKTLLVFTTQEKGKLAEVFKKLI